MATGESVVQSAAPSGQARFLRSGAVRFAARVAAGIVAAQVVISLAGYQARLVREEQALEFPLWVAMDELGMAVLETRLAARATVETGEPPSMARLKELAQKAAGSEAAGAQLWSEAGGSYRAVYLEGGDPGGGTWLVSGGFIENVDGSGGRVDLAVNRSVFGKVDAVPSALYAMKRRLERAAGRPLSPEFQLRATARPPAGAGGEEVVRELLARLGVGAATISVGDGEISAWGYSPKLPGRAEWAGDDVNVVVRLTERGRGPWIEVGTPVL